MARIYVHFPVPALSVNVNVNLYSALSLNASNALGASSTAEKALLQLANEAC